MNNQKNNNQSKNKGRLLKGVVVSDEMDKTGAKAADLTKDLTKKHGRVMKGVVVSDKMDKTVVVVVTRLKEHPKYKKRYKVTKRYKAHDEKNEYKIGDEVVIQEYRPMSKEKKWRVIKK
jgi:small subunit ribosomal protein S17